MDARRYFLSRSLAAGGMGLLSLGVVIFLIKLVIDIAYFAAAMLVLAGAIMLLAGWIIKRI